MSYATIPADLTLRPLGDLEQWFFVMDQHRSNHFSVVTEMDGFIDQSLMEACLLQLQEMHPILRSRIALDENRKPVFSQSPETRIDLEYRDIADSYPDWRRTFLQDLPRGIDPSRDSLLRCTFLRGTDQSILILTAHHASADGMALLSLLRDLLGLAAGEAVDSRPSSRSVEELYACTGRDGGDPRYLHDPSIAPRPLAYRNPSGATVSLNTQLLTEAETSSIRRCARGHGLTIHAVLTAVIAMAGQELFPAWNQEPIRVFSPIDLRPVLNSGPIYSVALGAGVVTVSPESGGDIWHIARNASDQLGFFRTESTEFMLTRLLGAVGSDASSTVNFTSTHLGFELLLTNPGEVAIDLAASTFRVRQLWGPLVLMGFEAEQSIGAMTFDGRLALTHLSATPPVGLLDKAVSLLKAACGC